MTLRFANTSPNIPLSDEGIVPAMIPFLGPTLSPSKLHFSSTYRSLCLFIDTPYDWNYTVVPQAALNNRVFPYVRGKILGGSTTISLYQFKSSNTELMKFITKHRLSGTSIWLLRRLRQNCC